MTERESGDPTLLDLVDVVFTLSNSGEEAAAVVNHMLRTGRVRLRRTGPIRQPATGLPGHL